MVGYVMIWTYMHRKSIEFIVNKILFGCPPPRLILGQEDYLRLELSRTKEILLSGNHDAFFKDLLCNLFQEQHSQL
jgi:hypothetical protein